MHLPGKKHTHPDISEPQDARRIEDEPQPQEIYNSEGITHQPSSAMDTDRPRDNHNAYLTDAGQAGQTEFAPPEELGMSHPEGNPNVQIIEKKLPFKEQVRAYNKVHRGTLTGDHEQKELGKAILRGDVPPQ